MTMTAFEMYEKMTAHLATMDGPSVNRYGKCKYRVNDAKGKACSMCLVGALISDDDYELHFDMGGGVSASSLIDRGVIEISDLDRGDDGRRWLRRCQSAHDGSLKYETVEKWREQVAEKLKNASVDCQVIHEDGRPVIR